MAEITEGRRPVETYRRPQCDMARLQYQFLNSQLDISLTLATFVRPEDRHKGLSENCRETALKGYQRTARALAHSDLPESEKRVLESKLVQLRNALQYPEAVGEEPSLVFRSNGNADATNGHANGHSNGYSNGHSDADYGQLPKREYLTPREREVLKCIAEGNSTKEVAGLLGITFKTASCHRSRVMDKLGIHNLTNLVRYAIREQIVQP